MHQAANHGFRSRVRSGCLTCRTRKVKCDEAKPVCNNCTRLKRHCTYKPKRPPQPTGNVEKTPPDRSFLGLNATTQSHEVRGASLDAGSRGTLRTSTVPPYCSTSQTPILYQGSTDIDVTACLKRILDNRRATSIASNDHREHESPLTLISRDIELTTTIDILALRTESSHLIALFLDKIDCPGITPFDSVNWRMAKHHIVQLATQSAGINSSVTAISVLYKAIVYGLPLSGAIHRYYASRKIVDDLVNDPSKHFSHTLVALFLLCVFELLHYGDLSPYLKEPSPILLESLKSWAQSPSSHSELDTRIVTWLRVLYSSTFRGGAMGLISERVYDMLPTYQGSLPDVDSPAGYEPDMRNGLYGVLSAPIFNFYLQLQILSGEIAKLSLYHRSRTTTADQREVVQQMASLKSRLFALWQARSPAHRQSPQSLRSQLNSEIADKLITLISTCDAAYHAEFVDICRQLGDPISKLTDSKEALFKIKEIIDSDRNHPEKDGGEGPNPGYLRSLFLYAIESSLKEEIQWAVDKIARIKNPVYRGTFFSEFSQALSEAQMHKERRVTSRYFCIRYFGVPPPYM